ncbi:hypothetical protein Bhyg_13537, partial [Pseudolycoriella hygida]
QVFILFILTTASDHITNTEQNRCTSIPPKKRIKFQFNPNDEGKLRKPGELRKELQRMRTVIDELIKPQVERYEQREVSKRKLSCLANKTGKNFEIKQIAKKPTAKGFMETLKRKEMELFKYRQSLLPIEPEQQKKNVYKKYFEKFHKASELFTDEVRKKTLITLN